MADRNPARVLAPLALIAAVIGIAVVVELSGPGTTSEPPAATSRPTTTQQERPARRQARVYVVKPGDTLTVIAERTDVTLETLERLNPDVDAQALQTGERLKLTP